MQIKNINLEFKGHSGFVITSPEKRIYIDPYKLNFNEMKADMILITHSHYDHCSIEDLRKIVKDGTIIICSADCQSKLTRLDNKIKINNLEPGQEITIEGVKIKSVPAYNINKQFHGKAEYWNGYVIEIEGTRVYHAGDTDLIPEMANLEDIDVALLPVSGVYTMTAEEAARAAILIRPKLTIPMHYSSIIGTEEDALRFLDRCQEEGIKCEILEKK